VSVKLKGHSKSKVEDDFFGFTLEKCRFHREYVYSYIKKSGVCALKSGVCRKRSLNIAHALRDVGQLTLNDM
jgi:hypothetical protein